LIYEGKNNHQFNRFYLLISTILLVAIPLLELPIFPLYVTIQDVTIMPAVTSNSERVEPLIFNWKNGMIFLWIVGAILNFFVLFKNIFSLYQVIKNSQKEEGNYHTKVFTNGEVAVSSFLNYLFIPELERGAITDYEIKHELTHIHQKHSIDILFIEGIKALLWFNPVIYLIKKRLIEIHEFLADQNTSKALGQDAYEDFLICQITAQQQPNLVHNFYSLFKKRLVMMQSDVTIKHWQYWTVLPIFLICFTLFSCENYNVTSSTSSELKGEVSPVISKRLKGETIDTIITFHPDTYEETVEYVKSEGTNDKRLLNDVESNTGIDTIFIFDPADNSERIIVVNHDTGSIDTLQ